MRRNWSGPRFARWARAALWLLAGWLLVSNLLLNTPALEPLVNRKPERFTMHWQRALMLWPGRVSLWGVEMHGQARHNAWNIQAGRVRGRIALMPLLRKEVRFVWIDGEQPRIQVQRTEHDLAPLPARENAARLVFQDVRVDSPLELVINKLRLSGTVLARVAWQQQLRSGHFELLPSELQLRDAQLVHDDRVWLQQLAWQARGSIGPHLRREHRGMAMLGFLNLELEVESRAPGLQVEVDRNLAREYRFEPGVGVLHGRVVLAAGRLDDATSLRLASPVHAILGQGVEAEGAVVAELLRRDGQIAIDIDLAPIPDLIDRLQARLHLDSPDLPLPPWEDQLQRLHGTVDLQSRFTSLRMFQPLLVRLRNLAVDGRGEVDAQLVLRHGKLAQGTRLEVPAAVFTVDAYAHRFSGRAQASAQLRPDGDDPFRLHADVRLREFDLAPLDAPGLVIGHGRDLSLELQSSGTLVELRDRMQASLRFANAELPDLGHFNHYLPEEGLRFLGGRGHVSADMRMDVAGDRNQGQLRVAAHGASLQLGDLVLRGDMDLDARLVAPGLNERRFALPGSRVRVRRAAILAPVDEGVEGWWADINIEDGRVNLDPKLNLEAGAEITLRDIRPVLSIFAQRSKFPRWIQRLVDAGQVEASGQVMLRDGQLLVEPLLARNDRFDTRARLRMGKGQPQGQLYARWGVLGLGMELGEGRRKLHLAGARRWFEAQPAWEPAP